MLVPALCRLCEEHHDCHACTQVPARPGWEGLGMESARAGDSALEREVPRTTGDPG